MSLNRTNTSPTESKRTIFTLAPATTMTNIAEALTDLAATVRATIDVRPFSKVRITTKVTTQAANGGEIRLQYSLDDSTYAYVANSGPAVSLVGTGVKVSDWQTIPDAAKRSAVTFRLITISGDGAEDPVFTPVMVELA